MTEEKREYMLYESVPTQRAEDALSMYAREGYEVVAVTPMGVPAEERVLWTLRLRREVRAATVEARLMDVQRRLDELHDLYRQLRRGQSSAWSELSRRVELLEAQQAGRATDRVGWLQNATGANEE